MKKLFGIVFGLSMVAMPLSLQAQTEDGGVVEDGAVVDTGTPDTGTPDTGTADTGTVDSGTGCGTMTILGECQGDIVRWCQDGAVQTVNCATEYNPERPDDFTCGLFDCTNDVNNCFGYWCVARAGKDCAGESCDISLNQGCVGGVCATSTACDPNTYTQTCSTTTVMSYCYGGATAGVVNEFDCNWLSTTAGQYTCDAAAQTSLPCIAGAGATCVFGSGADTITLACVTGYTCGLSGVCTQSTTPDAGARDTGARDTASTTDTAGDTDEPVGLCGGCSGTGANVTTYGALFGLLGLALAIRRRR